MNDGVGASWSESDWQRSAAISVVKGVVYAALLATGIVWAGRRTESSVPTRLLIVIAVISALAVVCVSWYASRQFLAIRPLL